MSTWRERRDQKPSRDEKRGTGRRSDGLLFDVSRVAAFNDAVIAIAITLLVLDISPDVASGASNGEVWHALRELLPNIAAFAFSFWVIARFWTTNLTYFQVLKEMDIRTLTYDTFFLFVIALLPFPTALLASSHVTQASVIVYATALAVASLTQAAMWQRLLEPKRRSGDFGEFAVFYRVLQYWWSGVIFIVSIPLSFVNVYLAMGFWVLFGFARLFSENSPDALRPFEDRYLERREHKLSDE